MINPKDFYKIDEQKVYQEMSEACRNNDMETLKEFMFHPILNGQHLISNPPKLGSIVIESCQYARLDMLQLFFDKTQVKEGINLLNQSLSKLLGKAIGKTSDVRIVEEIIKNYKEQINESYWSEENKIYYHTFFNKVFQSCIIDSNLSLFSYLLEKYHSELPSDYNSDFLTLMTKYHSVNIANYWLHSPLFCFIANNDNCKLLLTEYRNNSSIWQMIILETNLIENLLKKEDVLKFFTTVDSKALENIQFLLQKKSLNQSLEENLSSQEKINKPKL